MAPRQAQARPLGRFQTKQGFFFLCRRLRDGHFGHCTWNALSAPLPCENAELLHFFLAPRLSQTPKCSARSRSKTNTNSHSHSAPAIFKATRTSSWNAHRHRSVLQSSSLANANMPKHAETCHRNNVCFGLIRYCRHFHSSDLFEADHLNQAKLVSHCMYVSFEEPIAPQKDKIQNVLESKDANTHRHTIMKTWKLSFARVQTVCTQIL